MSPEKRGACDQAVLLGDGYSYRNIDINNMSHPSISWISHCYRLSDHTGKTRQKRQCNVHSWHSFLKPPILRQQFAIIEMLQSFLEKCMIYLIDKVIKEWVNYKIYWLLNTKFVTIHSIHWSKLLGTVEICLFQCFYNLKMEIIS